MLLLVSGAARAVLPFDHTGNIYVSMWTADEIAVFTPDGVPVERFTADGLDGPRGIAFNPANGEIWVAGEFSNAIHIFDHNHQLLRTLEHPDFNEPVGITFSMEEGVALENQLVYISNSNGNELMVFEQQGNLLRRFTAPALQDPNCSAFTADGSLLVANRLGGTTGSIGAVTRFDANQMFQFDFTTDGILSLMAVAIDANTMPGGFDDTVWVTSGAGDSGIYQFDLNGNLLTSLLPSQIDDGSSIIPQGIAFDGDGDFYVVSFLNEVIKFDSDGNFLMRFPTGSGTARSTAFQPCQSAGVAQECISLGVDATLTGGNPDNSNMEVSNDITSDISVAIESMVGTTDTATNTGGGGSSETVLVLSMGLMLLFRRSTKSRIKSP